MLLAIFSLRNKNNVRKDECQALIIVIGDRAPIVFSGGNGGSVPKLIYAVVKFDALVKSPFSPPLAGGDEGEGEKT